MSHANIVRPETVDLSAQVLALWTFSTVPALDPYRSGAFGPGVPQRQKFHYKPRYLTKFVKDFDHVFIFEVNGNKESVLNALGRLRPAC